MSDLLRTVVRQNAGTRWRVTTAWSATGCRVHADLGEGLVFRARGRSVEEAEERVALKIVEWADLRDPEPEDLVEQLEASIAIVRERRERPTLRVIKGGGS
jgi:hypothetical protein